LEVNVNRKLFVVVAVVAITSLSLAAQSKPSIQGAWRVVEVTITNPKPAPGLRSKGTYTDLQPSLLIFTGKHYSQVNDTATKPRPATPFKVPAKPTAEEMQAQWGPFNAQAGTYELSGTTLTRRPMVAKNPANQSGKNFSRATIKIDGNNLWITITDTQTGKTEFPATFKYVRVE
jgi:hypothetical protein